MMDKTEIQTELQVDVILTDKEKLQCSKEMMSAMNAITDAMKDIKDYMTQRREEIEGYQDTIGNVKAKYNSETVESIKLELAMKIVGALNSISEIEDDIKAYQIEKKAEIARFEETVNLNRSRLNRGKSTRKVQCTLVKDFKEQVKTYVRNDTGEVVRTAPLSEDDLQITLPVEE
jgi:virulence-associated protein VapD